MAGTIVACTNMIIMLSGLFFQPLIGFLLDWHHQKTVHHLHYLASDFTRAFSIIPASIIVAIIALSLVRGKKQAQKKIYCPDYFSLESINFGINFR